jgi:hypothetical protein
MPLGSLTPDSPLLPKAQVRDRRRLSITIPGPRAKLRRMAVAGAGFRLKQPKSAA